MRTGSVLTPTSHNSMTIIKEELSAYRQMELHSPFRLYIVAIPDRATGALPGVIKSDIIGCNDIFAYYIHVSVGY